MGVMILRHAFAAGGAWHSVERVIHLGYTSTLMLSKGAEVQIRLLI